MKTKQNKIVIANDAQFFTRDLPMTQRDMVTLLSTAFGRDVDKVEEMVTQMQDYVFTLDNILKMVGQL